MANGERQRGWRLGGRNAPKWLGAPCVPGAKARTKEDLELLQLVFQIPKLRDGHPVKELWHREGDAVSLAEARYDLHQLADDMRVIRDVPGAKQLFQAMIEDVEGYDDFRYELRVAGWVGRSPGQTLLALGGRAPGPDVQVKSRSGHNCGIACYRGRTWTPAIVDSANAMRELILRLGKAIATNTTMLGPGMRLQMGVNIPRFPVSTEAMDAAVRAFQEVWSRPTGTPQANIDDVTVSRELIHATQDTTWDVRIILYLPVPARERFRITSTLKSKLEREQKQWAHAYSGSPILFMEESDFCLGFDKESFESELVNSAVHSMQFVLSTWQFFADGRTRGSRIRVEQHDCYARPNLGTLNLGVHTFGESMSSYGDGYVVLTQNPNHAQEEWSVRPGAPGLPFSVSCIRPVSIERRMARIPAPPDGRMPTEAELLPLIKAVRNPTGAAMTITGSQKRPSR
jgi:hypothetical protein